MILSIAFGWGRWGRTARADARLSSSRRVPFAAASALAVAGVESAGVRLAWASSELAVGTEVAEDRSSA